MRIHVSMVFQNFNLWEHMTVMENLMEAPIHVQRRNRAEVRDEAEAMLERVGMKERVRALSSAIVRRPTAARGNCPLSCHETSRHAV